MTAAVVWAINTHPEKQSQPGLLTHVPAHAVVAGAMPTAHVWALLPNVNAV